MPTLTPGSRLGPYEILDAIGAGGMGEVYRGRDTRLDRTVAIKVLPGSLSADVPSRERFEREARAISSLNHPNICVLHDVGRERPAGSDQPPIDFLVMEYLEGETLSSRIAHPPSLKVEEAIAIAIQIAAALDRAHRQGIVHRDLKPGNVMLSKGIVKLLDFGLARLTHPGRSSEAKAGIGHGLVSLADLSMPTVSSPLTMKGTILGTLQYMAPEQLEGKEVDARADIFAFGGVLYEMLTGRRPFEGKSQASLIGAILDHQPPPVSASQPVSPPMLDDIVAQCLAKDPDERWQSVRDLKRQLEWVAKSLLEGGAATAIPGQAQHVSQMGMRTRALRVGAAIITSAAIAGGAAAWMLWPKAPVPPVVARFAMELPAGQNFTRTGRHVVALSPDGTRLVYVANEQLYLRALNQLTAVLISGTEGSHPSEPMFSPDGQWVAFWSNNELRKVPVTGGTPVTLCAAQNPNGASWVGDRILLGQNTPRGIVEVPANGGTPKLLVTVDEKKGEWAHGPQLVAGGRAVLFTLRTGAPGAAWDDSAIVVHELATGQRTVLVNGGTDARVLPTGHLVYSREATLFAVLFDEARLVVAGGAVPVQQGIQQAALGSSGAAQRAWSDAGAFVFVPGSTTAFDRALVWINRQGQEQGANLPNRGYGFGGGSFRVSPDGARIAVLVTPTTAGSGAGAGAGNAAPAGGGDDIWVGDMARGTLARLTFTGQVTSLVWTPDSRRVCYTRGDEVFCQAADGSGQAQAMFKAEGLREVRSISPDGTRMLAMANLSKTRNDIMVTTIGPPSETRALIQTTHDESQPAISPDGRWVAYTSTESGRTEVYVRPFPAVDQGRWQISTDGGFEARWARNGRELFFIRGGFGANLVLLSASVQPWPVFLPGTPAVVMTRPQGTTSFAYDVAPDGRFLFHAPASTAGTSQAAARPQMVVVQNWFEELKARVPVK